MYHSDWELTVYCRHHIAELAGEYQVYSQIIRDDAEPTSFLVQLRHRLGLALIQAGHALAGDDAPRRLPMPARPASWGQLSA